MNESIRKQLHSCINPAALKRSIQLCVALESRAFGVKGALLVPGASPLLALMPWENQVWGLPKVTLQYSQNQDPDQLAFGHSHS